MLGLALIIGLGLLGVALKWAADLLVAHDAAARARRADEDEL